MAVIFCCSLLWKTGIQHAGVPEMVTLVTESQKNLRL
jgi:hypothetical protein